MSEEDYFKFKIGDRVTFTKVGYNAGNYTGTVVGHEDHRPISEARYGVEVDGGNPFPFDSNPYFWARDLTLLEV